MQFKDKIKNNILSSVGDTYGTTTTVGEVIFADEKKNICSVELINNNGYKEIKRNIQVKIYSIGVISWFPKVGDLVDIVGNEESLYITSKHTNDYTSKIRHKTKNKNDILTNVFCDNMSGNIF